MLSELRNSSQGSGRKMMTNTQTILGAFAWSILAGILMLITFAPVSVESPVSVEFSARANAAPAAAAL